MKITGHKCGAVYKRYAINNGEGRTAALAEIDAYRAKTIEACSGQMTVPEMFAMHGEN